VCKLALSCYFSEDSSLGCCDVPTHDPPIATPAVDCVTRSVPVNNE
jgi:hypothetical protein